MSVVELYCRNAGTFWYLSLFPDYV